jgi:NADH:ubiquinone oxidoreductase subunit E
VLDVCVCIGTSCHLRGAEAVVERLQTLLVEQGVADQVAIKGAFCLEKCSEQVSVRVGDSVVHTLPDRVAEDLLPEIERRLAVKQPA